MKQKIINKIYYLKLGSFLYDKFIKSKYLYIYPKLSEEYFKYIKYINSDTIIYFNYDKIEKYNEALVELCFLLKKYKKNNKIEIRNHDNSNLNLDLLEQLNYENVFVNNIQIKEYVKVEKFLNKIIEPAKKLSTFEKYIYAYNITKLFKKYKENEENKLLARNFYKILNNEYIVCSGFTNFLENLLKKLDIKSIDLFLVVKNEYKIKDFKILKEETEEEYHSRLLVYLKDKKYNIDGYYISDPTWDNNILIDLYNFLAITIEENKTCFQDAICYELDYFDIKTVYDFSQKLKRVKVKEIISSIEKLDKKFVNKLKEKYKYDYDKLIEENKLNSLTKDIAQYIISKNNNPISGSVIFKAIRVIYKLFYGYEEKELDMVLEKVKIINKKYYKDNYPRVLKNGEYVINEKNKFDFKYLKKKK